MNRVAVVTDSIACLPKGLVDKYGIYIVPITINFGDEIYRDGIDITPSEVYRLLRKAKKLPTTSSPPPGAYLEAYRQVSQHSDSILCITLPQKISMGFDSAQQAREMFKEERPGMVIEILDCQTAAGGQGFVTLAAAQPASSGADLAQALEAARRVMSRVDVVAVMDTLHYLAKGGRVPKTAAWVASILSIKPILGIRGGEIGLRERARTKPRAVKRLLEMMREKVGQKPVHVTVMHADVLDEAERLRDQISTQFDCVELFISDFTPTMGLHAGPGVLGIAFYGED
jgi:DegV family protein with EDD domain